MRAFSGLRAWLWPALLVLAATAAAAPVLPEGVGIAPTPAWVRPVAVEGIQPADAADGVAYRLVETQLSLLGPRIEEYSANVFDIVDRSGLETGGHWSIGFQPDFQDVRLHRLVVVRDGVASDRLDQVRVELLRTEDRADRGIYDGWRTAEVLIPDLKVGDRVELAFSVAGGNPVLAHFVHRTYRAGYSQGVGLRRFRTLAPASSPLRWRQTGPTRYETREQVREGVQEIELSARPLPGVASEADVPAWFDGYGQVELSNASGWPEVSAWAARLFRVEASHAVLERKAGELGLKGREALDVLSLALDFVQREVRYVSLSLGESSHAPASPETTLSRRYGDCKDKSLLLAGLLGKAGVPAEVVLVNTGIRGAIEQGLPGPQAFDHAIVRARIDGDWVYVDPTRNPETGALADREPVDFGKGLAVSAGNGAGLVDFAPGRTAEPEVEVEVGLSLREPESARMARMQVTTHYRYGEANRLRARFRDDGPAAVGRDCVGYMRRHFDDIELENDPGIEDDADGNRVRVKESYEVPLVPDEDVPDALGTLNLRLFQIGDWLPSVRDTRRRWPLRLAGPSHAVQTVRMGMGGGWDIEAEDEEVGNKYFHFRRTVQARGQTLTIRGEWRRLADHVPAEDYAGVRADLRRVDGLLDYGVTLGGSGDDAVAGREAKRQDLVWAGIALLATVLVLVAAWLARERSALAGMLFRPRATTNALLVADRKVQAAALLMAVALPMTLLSLLSDRVAGLEPDWGIELLSWLLVVPQTLLFVAVLKLVFRMLGTRAAVGRLFLASAWAGLPWAIFLGLALLAAWPLLGVFADPAALPGGDLMVRVLLALLGGVLLLAGLAWTIVSTVVAHSEAAGTDVGLALAANVLSGFVFVILSLVVILSLLALGITVPGIT